MKLVLAKCPGTCADDCISRCPPGHILHIAIDSALKGNPLYTISLYKAIQIRHTVGTHLGRSQTHTHVHTNIVHISESIMLLIGLRGMCGPCRQNKSSHWWSLYTFILHQSSARILYSTQKLYSAEPLSRLQLLACMTNS